MTVSHPSLPHPHPRRERHRHCLAPEAGSALRNQPVVQVRQLPRQRADQAQEAAGAPRRLHLVRRGVSLRCHYGLGAERAEEAAATRLRLRARREVGADRAQQACFRGACSAVQSSPVQSSPVPCRAVRCYLGGMPRHAPRHATHARPTDAQLACNHSHPACNHTCPACARVPTPAPLRTAGGNRGRDDARQGWAQPDEPGARDHCRARVGHVLARCGAG